MGKLKLLAQELLAYARQIDEAVDRLNLEVIQSLGANVGAKALDLMREADELSRIAVQEAFRDNPPDGEP